MRAGGSISTRIRSWRRAGVTAVLATVLGACAQESTPAADLKAVLNADQMMDWVLDPNADVIWGAAGTITTAEGVEDLAPTTQEGWDAVRNAAAMLAETGNLLKMPGHSRGEDWNEIADGLTATALLLIDAAEQKDDEQVFDYGGQLYNVCVACHQRYMMPEPE
ncbi:MAG: hypothetical protein AB7I04_24525 [Pseudomonadales bacterium]